MENLHAKGPSRDWQRPCSVSSPLNSSKRPRREWRGSLPHLATLPTLTRVKLDSSGGRAKGGKVVRPAASTPGRPMGIRPQDAALGLRAGKPTQLRRVDIQGKIEQENNMHDTKSAAELYYIKLLPPF